MVGIAQKLFIEKGGKWPFNKLTEQPAFPFLDALLQCQQLDFVDYALAESLLRNLATYDQDVAAFICYLSVASRLGHVCVRIDDTELLPTAERCWAEKSVEDQLQLSPEDLLALKKAIIRGAKKLPEALVAHVDENNSTSLKPICRTRSLFYFHRNWICESRILSLLGTLTRTEPRITFEVKETEGLNNDQVNAILNVAKNSLTLVCGGPGTGKTHTAGKLIKIYLDALSAQEKRNCQICIAAPTGKAVSNLQSKLSDLSEHVQAQTLHALLGIRKKGSVEERSHLSADLIIVDESSMIDLPLMMHLLASIKPGARLVLLGDPFQLPPIGTGTIFADLVELLPTHTVKLERCLRTELHSIVDLADSIKTGDHAATMQKLQSHAPELVWKQEFDSLDLIKKTPVFEGESSIKDLKSHCILSPLRKGPFGVETINELMRQSKINNGSSFVAPIILTANEKRLKLVNGEIGLLVKQNGFNPFVDEGDYAIFPNRDGKKVPGLLLPPFDYAFCLSVHKSQGSEFDHVILLLPPGSEFFGRELLYTAATRARKSLEIWGSSETLEKTLTNKVNRHSGIGFGL